MGATRKQVDPKQEKLRNQKLAKIDEDFSKGIRYGKRLGETPNEEFMSKPEFVRRENKITTAPSRDMANRRGSLKVMIESLGGGSNKGGAAEKAEGLKAINESSQQNDEAVPAQRKSHRSHSTSTPRRLSYIGALSPLEEKNLSKLFDEKKAQPTGVVPDPNATPLPGVSSSTEDPEADA